MFQNCWNQDGLLLNLVFNRCQLWREWSTCHEYWWNLVCVLRHKIHSFIWICYSAFKRKQLFPRSSPSVGKDNSRLSTVGPNCFAHSRVWKLDKRRRAVAADVVFIIVPRGSMHLHCCTVLNGPHIPSQLTLNSSRCDTGVRWKVATGSRKNSVWFLHKHLYLLSPYCCHRTNPSFLTGTVREKNKPDSILGLFL